MILSVADKISEIINDGLEIIFKPSRRVCFGYHSTNSYFNSFSSS